jgi:hypothetical protein
MVRSYGAQITAVENSELLLCVDGRVGYPGPAAHGRRPRIFGGRLQLGAISELLLFHLDLCGAVFGHPGQPRAEPALF